MTSMLDPKKNWDYFYKVWPKKSHMAFGDTASYKLAYEWLKDCELIEDWGCGPAFFKTLCREGQYRGIDCSCTPHADEIVDLTMYHSQVPGIVMRHVLEHNIEWRAILRNALRSFTDRMVLILFTPFAEVQTKIRVDPNNGAPTLSLVREDVGRAIAEFSDVFYTATLDVQTNTMFKQEHIYFLERRQLVHK